MKEQLIYKIEQQLKEAHEHECIYVSQAYDEELDEAYDEWTLTAAQTNGVVTQLFLWLEGDVHFQQRLESNYFNKYDFESVEAFAKWWQVFVHSVTR